MERGSLFQKKASEESGIHSVSSFPEDGDTRYTQSFLPTSWESM